MGRGRRGGINAGGVRTAKSAVAIPLSKAIISAGRGGRALAAAVAEARLYKADDKLHSIHRGRIDLTALVAARAAREQRRHRTEGQSSIAFCPILFNQPPFFFISLCNMWLDVRSKENLMTP